METTDDIIKAAKARVDYETKQREKWEDGLVKLAKRYFETLLDVKPGDLVDYVFICNPEKVIYDGVCMDRYGNLMVKCYHLRKDGTPRAKASLKRWGCFYINEIKYKPNKED
jgi:hypothetical protein